MTTLASVTLSNVRRFGKDVKVDLSPGATVLLAPNGTGKTAFFEAIEFALTGMVSRLGSDLTPLIRDSQALAEVRLQFTDVERAVTLRRGGKPTTNGDLTTVFGATEAEDIPYLLRLTHLLDQRERDWFVQADEKTAGSHLARLPIGRDGSVASSVLTGARRSVTESLNQASLSLSSLTSSLNEWNSFIEARDASIVEMRLPLTPQSDIADGLRSILESVASITLPAFTGITSLASGQEVLLQAVNARIEAVQRRASDVAGASGLMETYTSERERVSRLEADRAAVTESAKEPRLLIERLSQELTQCGDQLDAIGKVRSELDSYAQRAIDVAHAKEQLDRSTALFSQVAKQVELFESELAGLLARRQVMEQAVQAHESFRSRERSIARAETELSATQELVDKWREYSSSLGGLHGKIEASHRELEQLGRAYQEAVALHAACDRAAGDAKGKVNGIASTVDAMRKAVSLVAANLGADRNDCPVCGVDHGAGELRRRLQNSLEAIDPSLAAAERELHDALSQLRAADSQVAKAKTQVQDARNALAQYQVQASALTSEIDAIRSDPLVSSESSASALAALNAKAEQLRVARSTLMVDFNSLDPEPSAEDLLATRSAFERGAQKLEEIRRSSVEVRSDLSRSTQRYASLSVDFSQDRSIEQISSEIVSADQRRSAMEDTKARLSADIERERARLAAIELQAVRIERDLGSARSRIAEIRSTWTQLELPGEPSAEIGSVVELQLSAERATLERRRTQLTEYGIEIGRWRTSEQNRVAQNIIDLRRGDRTEADFSQQLQETISKERARIGDLSKLSTALDSLSSVLSAEIGDIHDRVVAIVPRWQSLLKRIVRDQRFASTDLNFYSHYKKQHASVLIPLHGATVAAPTVASEAQMTDLQLTFLLSMALSHRWSTWRGLLLDDPTQHHDLVHASSVFDVLRDYVIEHGFQVVIATHDALQARFLMRKLQNDGVASRLWTLVPTAEGVTAVADGSRKRGRPTAG
ncbi:AAA family ATPase [Stenotrophomonas nitritireducens]|uniref:AAA family ATPase n=1 Tax=Stenotrophomonas nitritireducens TaxID=83617 RepID=UPI003D97BCF6